MATSSPAAGYAPAQVLMARYAQVLIAWGAQDLEVELSFSWVHMQSDLRSEPRPAAGLKLTCASARALVTRGLRPLINPPVILEFQACAASCLVCKILRI